ncbi:MAG: mechanosensitive ion channel family protein [Anaerolineae bacterium]|jgi:MscS family membrane protein|nr:mechanosensitive ion channel family protein [Anaerolineae bacterium]
MDLSQLLPFLQAIPPGVREVLLRVLILILVLALVWLLRRAALALIITPLKRLAARTKTEYDDIFLHSIERPIGLIIVALAISMAAIFLEFDPGIQRFAAIFTRSLIIAAVFFSLYNMVDVIAFTSLSMQRITGLDIEERLLPFLRTAAKVFILVIALLIILQEFGYDVTALIASFGIVGIGIGLAAQDTASNVFGFTAIVSDNPFNVGDYIEAGDIAGTVEHVGVRSTRLRRLDQSVMSVPNNKLTGAAVVNWSRLSKRRMDFYLTLSTFASSQQLRTAIEHLRGLLLSRRLVEPASVVVHVVAFNGKEVQIRVIGYILLKDWNAYTAECEIIQLGVMDILAGMGLLPGVKPTPQTDVLPVVPYSDVPAQANDSASNP